jgi:hypothetical protein
MLAAWVTGCSYLRPSGSQPKAQLQSLQISTNREGGSVTIRSLQVEVMRFADNYAAVIAYASDQFSAGASSPEARLAAAKWKLEQATAAYIDASGANPVVNSLDMVVLATASRMVMEDNVTEPPFGPLAAPLLELHRTMETNAWALAGSVMKPEQQQELREIIQEWRRNNPRLRSVAGLRFREFIGALAKTGQRSSSSPTSLFGLLFLDPMASMDPTTAAIEETRNTAERAMYYTQRMPTLLNWQLELLTYELAVQPETKQLLTNSARFVQSTEVFAKTAEELPKVISREREAAIKQVLEGLVPEEKKAREILADARALASETRETLKAGNATADSLNATIKTLDEFVRSVTPTNRDSSTNRPFDVLDYATTARDVGNAAKDVNALLLSVEKNSARLAEVRQQTAADAKAVVDHAFRRALMLLLGLVGAVLFAALIYRVAANRFDTRRAAKPTN